MRFDISLSVNNLRDFEMYAQAVKASQLPQPLSYVEILWDGYCHLQPEKLREYLSQFSDRVAFHIMWSRFLDRDAEHFEFFLKQLKHHVDVIQPIYVSDHLCHFKQDQVHLFQPIEIDYRDLEFVCRRVDTYQQFLDRSILIENHASSAETGRNQIEFFQQLMEKTGCKILFDISNARVAENNRVTQLSDWLEFLRDQSEIHAHLGSYSYDETQDRYFDSHDHNMDNQTAIDIETVLQTLPIKTLSYEREYNRTAEDMTADLDRILRIAQVSYV